jgi:hypothetical protein
LENLFIKQNIIGAYGILLAPEPYKTKYKEWLTELQIQIKNDLEHFADNADNNDNGDDNNRIKFYL